MPRFVLLYHACPPAYKRPSHWDVMFEVGVTLHTWSLRELPSNWRLAHLATATIDPCCPSRAGGNAVDAEQLGHHRLAYLEYEGPLSDNRGDVHRIDGGAYDGKPQSPDSWRVELAGSIISGRVTLQRDSTLSEKWVLRCDPQQPSAPIE